MQIGKYTYTRGGHDMGHGMVFLTIVEPNHLQTASFNIPLLSALIIVLIAALLVCIKLAKKYQLYEGNNRQEILKHT